MDTYRARLSKLLKRQEPIESYIRRLSVRGGHGGRASTPKPSSPKSPRPNIYSFPTYPTPVYPHASPPPPRCQTAPGWSGIGDIPFIPPPVPEIPQSPTHSSASSHTYSNHSNDSGEPVAHWAMKIFDGRHSSTPFSTLGERSICYGRDEPRAIEMLLDDGFEKVAEMPFEATNVTVRLYWRPDDNRARILYLTKDEHGNRMRYCFPLTSLRFLRSQSCLQLCRVNRKGGHLELWSRLRFTMYERKFDINQTPVASLTGNRDGPLLLYRCCNEMSGSNCRCQRNGRLLRTW